jgi:hypothetical protein
MSGPGKPELADVDLAEFLAVTVRKTSNTSSDSAINRPFTSACFSQVGSSKNEKSSARKPANGAKPVN